MDAQQAVILAGGFGTRLRSVVSELPKVLAPIAGQPFLGHLLSQLSRYRVPEVVLCVGYKAELVRDYVRDGARWDLSVTYSGEDRALGTGGALRHAVDRLGTGPLLVMNGDSFFDVPLDDLDRTHAQGGAPATLALASGGGDRYGTVSLDERGRITQFREKHAAAHGPVNGGVYVLNREVLEAIAPDRMVSLEREVFPALAGHLLGKVYDGFFIDIGVVEDYRRLYDDPSPLVKALS